jgi:hypothetical protein
VAGCVVVIKHRVLVTAAAPSTASTAIVIGRRWCMVHHKGEVKRVNEEFQWVRVKGHIILTTITTVSTSTVVPAVYHNWI